MSARNSARVASGSRLPAMNPAFVTQSRKKQDKLKESLSEQLRQDMKRLLAEGTFADISLLVNSERILVHGQILQTRLAEFFSSVVQPHMTGSEGEETVADLSSLAIPETELQNLLRAIYTEDNVKPYWNVFQDAMKSHDSAAPMECETTESDTDRKSPRTDQSLEYRDGITDLVNGNQTDTLAPDQSPDPSSVPAETNGMDTGDQTAASALSLLKVCEYAALGDVKCAAGFQPGTANQRTAMEQCDQPEAGIEPPDQDGAAESIRDNNAISCGIGTEAKQRTKGPASLKKREPAPKEVKAQGQSSDTSSQLPLAACQLGQDLLHIFNSKASGHDVIIKVDGKEIPAHRFMLCARSQYFSAMLEGSWRESSSSVIELSGFSHAAVMLALQFIYGGAYEIPDGAIIRDSLYLADMYGLHMFKDVVELKLRMDYCHFFHKPCSICLARIPECLVLSSSIDMSDLDQCVLSWLVQYLDRAWSEKSFASLPQDLLFKCRDAAIQSISCQSATVLLLRLNKLVCSLPRVKWTEVVHSIALHAQDKCTQYMATNLRGVVVERSFQRLLEGMNWNKDLLEPVFSSIVSNLTSDTASATFMAVHFLQPELTDPCNLGKWNPDAVSMVQSLYSQCYSYLVSNASLLAQARGWKELPPDIVERIKKEAVFIDSHGKAPARKPVLSSSLKVKAKSVSGSSKGSLELNSR